MQREFFYVICLIVILTFEFQQQKHIYQYIKDNYSSSIEFIYIRDNLDNLENNINKINSLIDNSIEKNYKENYKEEKNKIIFIEAIFPSYLQECENATIIVKVFNIKDLSLYIYHNNNNNNNNNINNMNDINNLNNINNEKENYINNLNKNDNGKINDNNINNYFNDNIDINDENDENDIENDEKNSDKLDELNLPFACYIQCKTTKENNKNNKYDYDRIIPLLPSYWNKKEYSCAFFPDDLSNDCYFAIIYNHLNTNYLKNNLNYNNDNNNLNNNNNLNKHLNKNNYKIILLNNDRKEKDIPIEKREINKVIEGAERRYNDVIPSSIYCSPYHKFETPPPNQFILQTIKGKFLWKEKNRITIESGDQIRLLIRPSPYLISIFDQKLLKSIEFIGWMENDHVKQNIEILQFDDHYKGFPVIVNAVDYGEFKIKIFLNCIWANQEILQTPLPFNVGPFISHNLFYYQHFFRTQISGSSHLLLLVYPPDNNNNNNNNVNKNNVKNVNKNLYNYLYDIKEEEINEEEVEENKKIIITENGLVLSNKKCSEENEIKEGRWVKYEEEKECFAPFCTGNISVISQQNEKSNEKFIWIPYQCFLHFYDENNFKKCALKKEINWIHVIGDSLTREFIQYSIDLFGLHSQHKFIELNRTIIPLNIPSINSSNYSPINSLNNDLNNSSNNFLNNSFNNSSNNSSINFNDSSNISSINFLNNSLNNYSNLSLSFYTFKDICQYLFIQNEDIERNTIEISNHFRWMNLFGVNERKGKPDHLIMNTNSAFVLYLQSINAYEKYLQSLVPFFGDLCKNNLHNNTNNDNDNNNIINNKNNDDKLKKNLYNYLYDIKEEIKEEENNNDKENNNINNNKNNNNNNNLNNENKNLNEENNELNNNSSNNNNDKKLKCYWYGQPMIWNAVRGGNEYITQTRSIQYEKLAKKYAEEMGFSYLKTSQIGHARPEESTDGLHYLFYISEEGFRGVVSSTVQQSIFNVLFGDCY